jgi:probable rRNA maturation factor
MRGRVDADAGGKPEVAPRRPEVLVSNRQGRQIDEAGLCGLAADVLRHEGLEGVELSLSFVTPEEMTELHVRYMGKEGPTDVLSFPMDEPGGESTLVGDVVVCPDYAVVAKGEGALESEMRLLVVHGTLHLLGYDHESDDERERMWARQERYSGVSV